MNIITGKLQPDEGKIEWAKNVRVGYLDQHTVLEKGMTIRDVLKSAFQFLFEREERMNHICDHMGDASPQELDAMMEELGDIQDYLDSHDFYIIDSKVDEIAHDIPFLNSIINLIYHVEDGELTRYVGDYDGFQEAYAMKKAQLEAAYKRQQQEIDELKDFVSRNKARGSTRNMAMSISRRAVPPASIFSS